MTVGVHWYRAVAFGMPLADVLLYLQGRWGERAVALGRGQSGYGLGFVVGHARVYANLERPDMGVMLDVQGEGCEALGALELAEVHEALALRCSRFDVAHDDCPFTPVMVADAWRSGDVRTRSKVPDDALPSRQWRKCRWVTDVTGDMFTMGARSSMQYARCYDRRGFTRFELELKGETAQLAADELLALVRAGGEGFALASLGWVRRFVDFVQRDSDTNASRCELLCWWDEFVGSAAKARVKLTGAVVRTLEQVVAWFENQNAPLLAVLLQALGLSEVLRLAQVGKRRWSPRHVALLAGG